MGLDQYLRTNAPTGQEHATGACGGLFPLAPKMGEDQREIGYWRKNYRLNEYLLEELGLGNDYEDVNCEDLPMTEDQIEDVISYAKGRKELLEEGYDCDDGWYDISDWEYTMKTFKKALKLKQQGYDIIYSIWY